MIYKSHCKLLFGISLIFMLASCNVKTERKSMLISGRGIVAENGMVTSAHPLASEVGAQILAEGGNAYDAAIAVHFALSVVYPGAGNIGGGGFAVYRKADGEYGSLDFREKAPKSATETMYQDDKGEVIPRLSSFGSLAVGVPGSVDGMMQLYEKLGSLPFEKLVQPAIDLAEKGFPLTEKEARKYNRSQESILLANDSTTYYFNGGKWKTGDMVVLPELAEALKLIRDKGRDGFYTGETAKNLIEEMAKTGGIISQEDLDDYHSVWRTPVEGTFRDYKVISMPPPSSGGVALLQLLKGSEAYNFGEFGHNSAKSIHVMTELERRVYADRATYLGDPDFYDVPVKMLLDRNYLKGRFADIRMDIKTDSHDIKEGNVEVIESTETTHFSIVDKDHNAIAITTTLNGIFGSKVYVEKSGFFLNNEMDDFSAKAGVPNQFGLVGGEANAIAPEKRMLSSMTPTILEKDGELFMVVGTPGGSTIITSVYQTIMNVTEFGMDIQEAINAKKTHHQWLPDLILYENKGLDSTVIQQLEQLGHTMQERGTLGQLNAVTVLSDGSLQGGSDPRADNTAVGVN
ncbi:gamma-glutamyltransferase [uncultured Draconibacterium sp.]|uniref:gamma-glutamyltransferase n=1 Tax=uncultured Draconibacterium sp. TaxID=1573823 RepID=UPI0029C6A5EC|nr:gamma-glutamyltransferase [uncultured Draconibacterium sp.]